MKTKEFDPCNEKARPPLDRYRRTSAGRGWDLAAYLTRIAPVYVASVFQNYTTLHDTSLPMVPSETDSVLARRYDDRLEFLRLKSGPVAKTPLRSQFEHRIPGAHGPVEVVYYPRRDGSQERPEQLSLFILGMYISNVTRS